MNARIWYENLKNVPLTEDFLEFFQRADQKDTRLQCLKTFLKTEFNYLKKIRDLLTLTFEIYEKSSGKQVTKSQLELLYKHLPVIFNLHYALHSEVKNEKSFSKGIGKQLIKFLFKSNLLNVYLEYVAISAEYLRLCQNMKLNEVCHKSLNLTSLESILMMPIQRFPQLQLVIGDLCKHTNDTHDDKVYLFKCINRIRAISMSMDQCQKQREAADINEIVTFCKRLRINLKSSKVISKYSVFYLKPDFSIPRKLIKLPYYLILFDEEVIMYPKDISLNEIPPDTVFFYSLNDISIHVKNIFGFSNSKNGREEFQKAKELFPLIKDSSFNDHIINEVEDILHDYNIIVKIYDDIGRLNYSYHSLEQLKISRTLLKLETKLCEKERDLNNYFDSIISLKIKRSDLSKDDKLFQFDSTRMSNNWKADFSRAKFSYGLNKISQWIPIMITKPTLSPSKDAHEFPLSFNPYFLNSNGIANFKTYILKYQVITIIIGTKVCRCLWLFMSDGSVIIIHFNYKEWNVLEKFQTNLIGPITAICNVSVYDPYITDEALDHEIWVGFESQIVSFPLKMKEHSEENFRLQLPFDICSICQIESKMYVALKSLDICVYMKSDFSKWALENVIKVSALFQIPDEIIQNIYYERNKYLYILFKKHIAVIKDADKVENSSQLFTFSNQISCFHYCSDGIWLTTTDNLTLTMYDLNLKHILQIISIPISFFGKNSVDSITAVLVTEKNMWIGTAAGYIILITMVDRLSCIDSRVTTYLNSKFSSGPINFLFSFRNSHGVHLKTKYQTMLNKRNISDIPLNQMKRCNSNPEIEAFKKDSNTNSLDVTDFKKLKRQTQFGFELDVKLALDGIKSNIPTLILAIGDGLTQFEDFMTCKDRYPSMQRIRESEQLIFTFLE